MKFHNNILNIYKDKLKRVNYVKIEIKKIILKSIIQNKNIKPKTRAYAKFKLLKMGYQNSISKQNNICLKTGRYGGVLKLTNFSRHYIKKLGIHNNLQNIKIIAW